MLFADLPSNALEDILTWADLPSLLRFREASSHFRREMPRLTTTLWAPSPALAGRWQIMLFGPHRTSLRSIAIDFGSISTLAQHAGRVRSTLMRLWNEHRPSELRITNIKYGVHFSGVLAVLEDNIESVRQNLRVLQLGLATGGARPYQDPLMHRWYMLRLGWVLGRPGTSSEDDVSDLIWNSTSGGSMQGLDDLQYEFEKWRTAHDGNPAMTGTGYWPWLTELRLSCGIMDGDLESISECLGRKMPALRTLVLEGHPFRPPRTDLMVLAGALSSWADDPSHHPDLSTLCLKHFEVQGVGGMTHLGTALSGERFPRLSSLAIENCRLKDDQLAAIAEALSGMSPRLKSIHLRGNYALSADGISALASALGGARQKRRVNDKRRGLRVADGCLAAAEIAAHAAGEPVRAPAWSIPSASEVQSVVTVCELPPARALDIHALDLSFSCWWRRRREGGRFVAPLVSLVTALGQGVCPNLRTLSFAGCQFGDEVVDPLVTALENGCRALRMLDITGNLISQKGVRALADSLASGKMPPHMKMVVVPKNPPPARNVRASTSRRTSSYRVLDAAMPLDVVQRTVDKWIAYQRDMRAWHARSD